MTALIGFLASLVVIAAHLFVIAVLLFASSLLIGRVVERICRLLNAGRVRADMGPHPSRGWQ